MRTLVPFAILTAAVLAAPAADAATLTTPTSVRTIDLATGAKIVRLAFDLPSWRGGETMIVRHTCPPGVEMHSQGFAIVKHASGAEPGGLRANVVLTNARNMPGAGGAHGFSWYIVNKGQTSGPVRLEISFVAKRVVDVPAPPTEPVDEPVDE